MLKIKALGVEEVQGFYYYRPMPAADIFALTEAKLSAEVCS
jgi:EAL domain-containing protein (putative c-di-GMP-specific phosphodiesterase class I)